MFLDVGANLGDFTELMANVWPESGSEFYLFEMMPKLQDKIRNRLKRRIPAERLHLVHAAVGDEPGLEVPIMGNSGMGDTWTGASLLERDKIGSRTFHEQIGSATTVSLSTWAGSEGGMGESAVIPMMKIDTEGMDGKVLRGMTSAPVDLLASGQVRSIFFELNQMSLKTDVPPREQFSLLSEKGYDTYLFTRNRLVRISDECFLPRDYVNPGFYTRNALALPKGELFSCCVLTAYDKKDRGCGCS